ncbi:MAG: aminotransferase class I/II-fold pyridoxal phosphate-dependent enzyme, partial [Candidatus Cloacimonetes bacterium]|nr:aminotransferase class I/II-fold pyridoxal phosphate-dependent enzyme [Candidatus Cloacimonadota bacterium]
TEVVQTLTAPHDGIVILTPVYRPFYNAVTDFGRKLLISPLINSKGAYSVDWENLESCLKQAKMLILCSPHNPVGRVWSRDELLQLGRLCRKHRVLVFSDEIHEDIIYPGFSHIPFSSLEDFSEFTITGISPAKSFNIAGLATAVLVIPNYELFKEVNTLNEKMHLYMGNSFGIKALIAAYNQSEAWLEELLSYLNGNRQLLTEFVLNKLPGVVLSPLEGTYLAWLDFRAWGLSATDLQAKMINKARLALDPGPKFGDEAGGFLRMNFSCPKARIKEALERIHALYKEIS